MWRRLDDDKLLDAYRHEVPSQPLLAQLLDRLRQEPWAGKVSAVVSLGHLRFTTAPSHDVEDRHGCVGLGFRDGKIGVSLHPAGVNMATDSARCTPDKAPTIVGNWMQRLLDGHSLHPLDEPTEDTCPARPGFDLEQRVRVIQCGGGDTGTAVLLIGCRKNGQSALGSEYSGSAGRSSSYEHEQVENCHTKPNRRAGWRPPLPLSNAVQTEDR